MYNGILFSFRKERNSVICGNVDKLKGHYAKRNKPNRERQILRSITHMWNQKKKKDELQKHSKKVEIGCQGWEGDKERERLVAGYKLSAIR